MKRTIAIFSDIHGNYPALVAILSDIKKRGIKTTICLGDIVGIGPRPRECLDLIMANKVQMVIGNHELYMTKGQKIDHFKDRAKKRHEAWMRKQLSREHLRFIKSLPLQITKRINGHSFAFQHFLFNPDPKDPYPFDELNVLASSEIKDIVRNLDAEVTFVGHMHFPSKVITRHKKVIDVGTSGCISGKRAPYTILTVTDNRVDIQKVFVDFDKKALRETLQKVKYPAKDDLVHSFFGIKI